MKSKLLQLRKVFLVAAGLLVGASTWAEEFTITYDFKTYTESLGLAKNNAAPAITQTTKYGRISGLQTPSVDFYNIEDYTYNGKTFYFDNQFANQNADVVFRNGGTSALQAIKGNRHFAMINLKAGDKLSFTHSGGIKFANPNVDGVDAGTYIEDGTTYVVSTDGAVALSFDEWAYLFTVTITSTEERMQKPTFTKVGTGEGGVDRLITVAHARTNDANAVMKTYYTTTESENPCEAADKKEYTTPITATSPTTYYFQSVNTRTGMKSGVVVVDAQEAGARQDLATPTVRLTGFAAGNDGYLHPVYTFESDQSGVAGNPSVTYTYTVNGVPADVENPTSYMATSSVTLVVTANNDDYNSASSEPIEVVGGNYVKSYAFDAATVTKSDDARTNGNQTTVNGAGCNFYMLEDCTINLREDIKFSGGFAFAWKITANQAYGFYTRVGNGTINFKLEDGEYIEFVSAGTILDSSENSKTFAQWVLITAINIYSPVPDSVYVDVEDYATFSSPYALDFANATGVKAYTATIEDNKVKMTKVAEAVPANTGLFLQKVDGEVSIPTIATASALNGDNLLKATTGGNIYNAAKTQYVFANQNDVDGFYRVKEDLIVAAGKAYLEVENAGTEARLSIVFEGETTGITMVVEKEAATEAVYNLNGQRVAQPTKGLYIVNGKKVIKK